MFSPLSCKYGLYIVVNPFLAEGANVPLKRERMDLSERIFVLGAGVEVEEEVRDR